MSAREIDQKIVNGCGHRWMPVWLMGPRWLNRRISASGDVDPKVAVIADDLEHRKFYEAGYKRGHRCLRCGMAYLAKTGAVVMTEVE